MEKVIACYSTSGLSSYDIKEVIKYLEQGWTVKSVTMTASEEYTNAVFVLEKQ